MGPQGSLVAGLTTSLQKVPAGSAGVSSTYGAVSVEGGQTLLDRVALLFHVFANALANRRQGVGLSESMGEVQVVSELMGHKGFRYSCSSAC